MEDAADNSLRGIKEEHITIHVQKNDNSHSVCFRIKRNTPLKRLMHGYCDYTGTNYCAVKFVVDGRRVKEDDTPDKLEMEDGECIDVFNDQTGGSKLPLPPAPVVFKI